MAGIAGLTPYAAAAGMVLALAAFAGSKPPCRKAANLFISDERYSTFLRLHRGFYGGLLQGVSKGDTRTVAQIPSHIMIQQDRSAAVEGW